MACKADSNMHERSESAHDDLQAQCRTTTTKTSARKDTDGAAPATIDQHLGWQTTRMACKAERNMNVRSKSALDNLQERA